MLYSQNYYRMFILAKMLVIFLCFRSSYVFRSSFDFCIPINAGSITVTISTILSPISENWSST